MLRDARQRGWLHAYQSVLPEQYTTYIGFEGEARGVWNYESLFVPGLVQTEDYARAVIGGGFPSVSCDEIERMWSISTAWPVSFFWKKKAMSAGINLCSTISAQ